MLETIASFREPQEAHMLSARLAAEGIFSQVDYRFHVGNAWQYSNCVGGAKVRVLRNQLDDALVVERASRRGELKSLLHEKLGDLDDVRCPVCGSMEFSKRRPVYQAALSAILIFLAGIFPPWRWICFCKNCGTRFLTGYGLIGKSHFVGFDFRYRPAGADDASIMLDLRNIRPISDSRDATSPDYAAVLARGGKGWLCHLDGNLRAFGIADPVTRRIEIFVDPDFERNGVGRVLHNAAVDWLFELTGEPIWTLTIPQSKGQKFLYAAGWRLADIEDSGEFRFDLDLERWAKRKKKF